MTVARTTAEPIQTPPDLDAPTAVEVSFVMPCLNEIQTLKGCIQAARACIDKHDLAGEVVVADNGSADGSQALARRCGARVIDIREKGYGSALRGGIAAARGRFIVMGDSDLSYDFSAAMPFIERLRSGEDLVMGTRFGHGRIMPGAMPLKHKYLGNPVLSWLGRTLFRTPIRDFHCGLRAFRKDAFERWDLKTTGMEFASEMVIKATVKGARISEVPITLYKDGRDRPPHLRSWRDGWRHLRFMLCLSPRWTLLIPGIVLLTVGLVLGALVALGPLHLGRITLDVHTMIAAAMLAIVGYQCVTVAIAMRIFTLEEELGPPEPGVQRLFSIFTLERGVVTGLVLLVLGVALIGSMVWKWVASGFGPLDQTHTLRPMVGGATLVALGVQTVLMSFVYSMMGIKRR
jgi:hypothetical protein